MNPKAIVSASVIVLNDNREILLIRGRRGWEMPQGRMEEGESVRETAVREVREETGIDINLTQFCGVYHNLSRGVCNFIFMGEPVGGQLATSPESLEVGYYSLEEAMRRISWGNFKERIVMALNPENHPFLVEFHEQGAEFHE